MNRTSNVIDWTSLFARLAVATALLGAAGCLSASPPPEPVTVPDVVAMSKSGTPTSDILLKMKESGTVYRLTASQLSDLTKDGVAPEVIDYMQQTYLEAVRKDSDYEDWKSWTPRENFWYGGAPYGWPYERIIVIRERSHMHDTLEKSGAKSSGAKKK